MRFSFWPQEPEVNAPFYEIQFDLIIASLVAGHMQIGRKHVPGWHTGTRKARSSMRQAQPHKGKMDVKPFGRA